MATHDEELERYLSQFRPRPVRALEVRAHPKPVKRGWLIAAALAILVGGVSLWSLWHLRQQYKGTQDELMVRRVLPPAPSPIALTKLALEDNERFEALLVERSRNVLPGFQGKNSTLAVLAKE